MTLHFLLIARYVMIPKSPGPGGGKLHGDYKEEKFNQLFLLVQTSPCRLISKQIKLATFFECHEASSTKVAILRLKYRVEK